MRTFSRLPPGEEELLDPEDENQVLTQGHDVKVKQGDDDQQHMKSHEQTFDAVKYALSPVAFKKFTDHIKDHYSQMSQKQQQQMQQMHAQYMMQMQAQSKNGNGAGPGMNTGQAPGMSAFTQTTTPQAGNLGAGNGQ